MPIVIVIGGVYSGLGKGVLAASIGKIFERPNMVKFDGYYNVNPGTMRPTEHGECFVLSDGTEVDLDFGHYERFLGTQHTPKSITMGSLMKRVHDVETKASLFEGESVEQVPHLRDLLVDEILSSGGPMVLEIGGSVGDSESSVAMHAAKALVTQRENVATIFIVPVVYSLKGEVKTRPMRRALMDLRMYGLEPDVMVVRSSNQLSESVMAKIQRWSLVKHLTNLPNAPNVYAVPQILADAGFYDLLCTQIKVPKFHIHLEWAARVAKLKSPSEAKLGAIHVALCGKYDDSADAYLSIREAILHAAAYLDVCVTIEVLSAESETLVQDIQRAHAIIVPGGYGSRGVDGKLKVLEYARAEDVPCLGICYGLQLMAVEFARNVLGWTRANSMENDPDTSHPVVVESEMAVWGNNSRSSTQHTGDWSVTILPNTLAAKCYRVTESVERHRHRYCVNDLYEEAFREQGFHVSGWGGEIEIMEAADKTFYMGTQFHPEFSSSLLEPAPLLVGLLSAAMPKF